MSTSDEKAGQRLNRLGTHVQYKELDSGNKRNSTSCFDCCGVARTPSDKKILYIFLATIIVTGTIIVGLVIAVAILATGYESKANASNTANTDITPHAEVTHTPIINKASSPESSFQATGHELKANASSTASTAITSHSEGPQSPIINKCASSPECSFQASQMILSVNPSVDPCDDFYKFACGRKIDNAVVDDLFETPFTQQEYLPYKRIRGLLTQTYDKTDAMWKPAQVYAACVNNDDNNIRNALKSFVTELGGFPMAGGASASSTEFQNLLPFLKKFRTYSTEGALFSVSVSPKLTNTSRLWVKIAPPKSDLPSSSDIISLVQLVNLHSDDNIVSRDITDMRQLSYRIREAFLFSPEDMDDMEKEVAIDYLTDIIFANMINWLDLLNTIFEGIKQFKNTDKVLISYPEYFKSIASYLSTDVHGRKGRSVVNLEILHLLTMIKGSGVIPGNSNGLKKSFLPKLTNSNLQSILTRPWARCVSTASEWLSYIIAPKYAKHYLDGAAALESVKVMTTYILQAFRDRVKELSWLDDGTRNEILTKLSLINLTYLYPEWANDAAEVNKYYDTFVVGNSHVTNYLSFSKFTTKKNYMQITQDGLRVPTWSESPLTVNAVYYPMKNSINIFEGIMQPQTFSLDRLNVMNYGTLGMILAHEITHSLDKTGSRFDGQGNPRLNSIWQNEDTKVEAEKRFDCFEAQYWKYQLTLDDLPGFKGTLEPISGSFGIDENVADNGGIRNSYRAYKKWEKDHGAEVVPDVMKQYTHDQLFFISFANNWCTAYRYGLTDNELAEITDEHSPPRFRVIGPLSNLEEFGKAFNCPSNSRMAPRDRCELW